MDPGDSTMAPSFPIRMSSKSALAALCFAAIALMMSSHAAPYPERPITIVVAYPPGAATDIVARIVSDRLRDSLGQPVIVENIAGANGSIGVGRVARAAPDGYTFIIGNWNNFVSNGAVYDLKYDLRADFTPIGLLCETPLLVTARNTLKSQNLKEFIAWLKDHPDTATEGHAGIGSIGHLVGLLFQRETSTHFQVIPYRGGAPAVQDLLAGHIDFILNSASDTLPEVRAKTIRAYAVTARQRLPALSDVPTVDEAGLPRFYFSQWFGFWGPKGVPDNIVRLMNGALIKALANTTVQSHLATLGLRIFPPDRETPAALAALQTAEINKWWPIIRNNGIKAQ
jgi:tripartite-type tricarboxylate transporter receptor subunit TctC